MDNIYQKPTDGSELTETDPGAENSPCPLTCNLPQVIQAQVTRDYLHSLPMTSGYTRNNVCVCSRGECVQHKKMSWNAPWKGISVCKFKEKNKGPL